MGDVAKLAINQITTGEQWGFRESVEGFAVQGVRGIGVWRDRLTTFGVAEGARVLRDQGMRVASYCFGGLFADAVNGLLEQRVDDFKHMLDEAAEIEAAAVVFLAGGLPDGSRDLAAAEDRALEGLDQVIPHARSLGITIGLEPLHPMTRAFRSVLVNVDQTMDWIERLGSPPELGVVFDTYALWWDPRVEASLERAAGRICAFHISDWLRDTRDLRLDRGMMGDGCIDLPRLRNAVEASGYAGWQEVEILSERNWWRRDPVETTQICIERFEAQV